MNRLWKRFDQSLDDDSGLHGIRRLVNNATMTEIKFEKVVIGSTMKLDLVLFFIQIIHLRFSQFVVREVVIFNSL